MFDNKSYNDSETFDDVNLMFWNSNLDGLLPGVHQVKKVDCSEQIHGLEGPVFQMGEGKNCSLILRSLTRALMMLKSIQRPMFDGGQG